MIGRLLAWRRRRARARLIAATARRLASAVPPETIHADASHLAAGGVTCEEFATQLAENMRLVAEALELRTTATRPTTEARHLRGPDPLGPGRACASTRHATRVELDGRPGRKA